MQDKTPIQTAITFWNERYKEAKEAGAHKSKDAADLFLNYLDAMLSAEKEFAEKCFEAGVKSESTENGVYYTAPDKKQFLNNLYATK